MKYVCLLYMFFVFSAFFSSNTHHWYFQILLKTPQLHRCHARSRSSSTCAAKPSRGPNFSSSERKGPWDVWEVMGKPWENHGKTYGKPMENLWTCLEKISMKYHMMFWLVVWNMFFFPFSWECHHPNWRSPSFFRGVGIPPTRYLWIEGPQFFMDF